MVNISMQRNVLLGLMLLVGGNIFSSLYDISIKYLPDDANPATFLMVRQVSAVFMLLPIWFYLKSPKPATYGIHIARANIGVIGSLALIIGISSLPIATVCAIFYAFPLIIMVLGYFFFNERVKPYQWLCTVLGFMGIMIILRPSEISLAGIAALISATSFAISQLTLKKMPSNDHPIIPLLYFSLLGVPLTILMAATQSFAGLSWQMFWVGIAGNSFLIIYHAMCVIAYRQAQASDLAIAEYFGLLFVVFLGWLLFDEWLDNLTWIGAGLIIFPSILIPLFIKQYKKARIKPVDIMSPSL